MEEKRRFFRINDSIGLSYQKIGAEEAKVFAQELRQGGSGLDYVSNFDNRIHTLLESARIQSPVMAELVDLLNRKINLLINELDVSSELAQSVAFSQRHVNISACGMAFEADEDLLSDQMLRLDLSLHPGDLQITLLARVIACSTLESHKGFFVRVNFEQINSSDQELLIQYIVRRQSLLLKERRHIKARQSS